MEHLKLLRTISSQDLSPGIDMTDVDITTFDTRRAARAVLLDEAGQVYLLHAAEHGYHKLPGGGIEKRESVKAALAREIMEEIGCEAKILVGIGKTIEYRKEQQLAQTSFCYLAQQTGELQTNALDEYERVEGLEVVQAQTIDDAIALLRADKPDNIHREFMRTRDLTFLESARDVVKRMVQP